jgi:hypothetical protein
LPESGISGNLPVTRRFPMNKKYIVRLSDVAKKNHVQELPNPAA